MQTEHERRRVQHRGCVLIHPKTNTHGQGFTLVELLVVIAITATLALIAMVSVRNIMQSAKETKHVSNLRQVWSMVLLYAADNQGRLPPNKAWRNGTWQNHLVRWQEGMSAEDTSKLFSDPARVKSAGFLEVFNSPLNKKLGNMAFGSGGWPSAAATTEVFGRPLATIADPSRSIALLPYFSDTKTLLGGDWQRPGSVNDVSFGSKGFAQCAFVDGSIGNINRESIEDKRYVFTYPSVAQPE